MLFDVHTHSSSTEPDVVSIVTLNIPDYIQCCGLDLQHIRYAIGIHPWKIHEDLLSEHLRFMEQNIHFNCVKAIGECGLDRLCETPWDLQLRTFHAQINISEKFHKPMIIHCVKAFDELIALHKTIQPQQTWIIHGFRGKPQQMRQLIKQGFNLSLGMHANENTIREIPLDKLFLETDDTRISIRQVYQKVLACTDLTEENLTSQIAENWKNCRFI